MLVALLAVAACAGQARAAVRYVDISRPDDSGDGLSWATARKSLQTALGEAQPGDEIWVVAGEYQPTETLDRTASFFLKSGVGIYGGFAGFETSRSQRDVMLNETVLCGDLLGNDLEDGSFIGSEENSYHVVVALNVDETAILDGFEVCCGRADGPGFGADPASQDQGSGINIYDASPRIVDCMIRGNWSANHGAINDHGIETMVMDCAFEGNYSDGFGAGLYVHHHSHTHAMGCVFFENRAAETGGGFYCRSEHGAMVSGCTFVNNAAQFGAGAYTDPDSVVFIMDCTFIGNVAEVGGGGVFADISSTTLSGCTFEANSGGLGQKGGEGGSGGSGGGGAWMSAGVAVVRDCVFEGNIGSFGAGLYNSDGASVLVSGCAYLENVATEGAGLYNLGSVGLITECVFEDNSVTGGVFPVGGGMSNYFADVTIDRCTYERNGAEFGGGGLYLEGGSPVVMRSGFYGNIATGPQYGWGGGVLSSFATTTTVRDCVLSGNYADVGGGMHNMIFSAATIEQCTFAGNQSGGRDGAFGGGFYNNQDVDVCMKGCVAWGNTPDALGGIAATVSWSDVEGGAAGVGNFSSDPLFVDPFGVDGMLGTADDDVRIGAGSPCVNGGDPNDKAAPGETDFGGEPRVMGCRIDVGAAEFVLGPVVAGDFDGSGAVSTADVGAFVAALLASTASDVCTGDMTGDGLLDGLDIWPFTVQLLGR